MNHATNNSGIAIVSVAMAIPVPPMKLKKYSGLRTIE